AAGAVQARDETDLHRIRDGSEDDRYGCGGCLCCDCRRGGQSSDHGHLAVNQFGRKGRQPIVLIFGPTIFDCDVPALSKASRAQASKEGGYRRRPLLSRCTAKDSNHPRRRLLRPRRTRPRDCRAAEQRDEVAPSHSISSSASNCTALGTSTSIALAACRLMTNSYLADCMTGRSAGLAPLRTRPVWAPS